MSTITVKDSLITLTPKSDFAVIKNFTTDDIIAAFENIGYDEYRKIYDTLSSNISALSNKPGQQDTVRLLKRIQSTIDDIKDTIAPSHELILASDHKDLNALITNPGKNMPALVSAEENTMISGFNESLKVIRAHLGNNIGEDAYRNSKEVIQFTGIFRKDFDETFENMSLKERFAKAYTILFGDTGIRLTMPHNLQYGDVIDLNNPVYALVLLTATGEDELSLVEKIREEVLIEKSNGRFDSTLFMKRCEDELYEIMGGVEASDILSIILPKKEVMAVKDEDTGEIIDHKLVEVVSIEEEQKRWVLQYLQFQKTPSQFKKYKAITTGNDSTSSQSDYVPEL